jgi:acyl carrier protein
MTPSADAVREFVVGELAAPLRESGFDPHGVGADFDLLTSGVVDSLGMLELVVAVNERFDLDLDFEGLDPEQLTILGPLSEYVARVAAAPGVVDGS